MEGVEVEWHWLWHLSWAGLLDAQGGKHHVDGHNDSLAQEFVSVGVEEVSKELFGLFDGTLGPLAVESLHHSLGEEWHELGHEHHLQVVLHVVCLILV